MMNLGDVLDKYTSKLTFTVRLDDIDENFCTTLAKMSKQHKGKVPMQVLVFDPRNNLTLTFNSPAMTVSVRDAIPLLHELKGVYDIKPLRRS